MPSVNKDSFTFFFLTLMLFLPFCLIIPTRTFNVMLIKSEDGGHPSLVDLREKANIISLLSVMLYRVL